ncbi:MAG TPA: hypothetical protein VFW83_01230 [Bryobacteraceae bacterium]|nr:hypothetical protein [Bryobacteraceae bacterium]
MPGDLSGCGVSIAAKISDRISNFATIAVAASGEEECDGGGWLTNALNTAVSGGAVSIGTMSLDQFSNRAQAHASFLRYSFQSLIRSASVANPSVGDCKVQVYAGNHLPLDPYGPDSIDAGRYLVLTRPDGSQITMGGPPIYVYPYLGFLMLGQYSIRETGSESGIGAFTANIDIPPSFSGELDWTNASAISSISRASDLTVRWTTPATQGLVYVNGVTAQAAPARLNGSFLCVATAAAGSFTVPSYVLSAIPANSAGLGSLTISYELTEPDFSAEGLTAGLASISTSVSKQVDFR